MYRILMKLDAGKYGCLTPDTDGGLSRLDWLKEREIKKLVEIRAVSPVAPPPLSALPGWVTRSEKLEALGIVDVVQLLNADSGVVAEAMNYKRAATIDKWKAEARKFIETPPARKPRR